MCAEDKCTTLASYCSLKPICGATIERGPPEGSISQKSGDITFFADTVDLVALFMETVDLRALFADVEDGKDVLPGNSFSTTASMIRFL